MAINLAARIDDAELYGLPADVNTDYIILCHNYLAFLTLEPRTANQRM